jgi:hypothetical protein
VSSNSASEKAYFPPTLKKPTFEQASLFLTGYAWIGDPGARELLKLLFPEPGVLERENKSLITVGPELQITPAQRR